MKNRNGFDQYGRFPMDSVFTLKVIICTKTRRGQGVDGDPIRVITEVYTTDGDLIAEYDPQRDLHK